ncbi:redoxin domain-containing protein [Maribellus comscasis]|uniref:Redoxin domain-containing protein n=1 Tax=Maribellus comscasis TaxID=2681766 RepID=A0A6I6JUW4_9BACT|nr:TlpA disulfide reductase family protein [Maribellus comscasis]QGY46876.1 redoxin domain-containing protein [Maribellus comscasis]
MKNLSTLFLVIALFSCQDRTKTEFVISGNIEDAPDSTIVQLRARYGNVTQLVATDTIIDGNFEFRDTLEARPAKMVLVATDWKNFSGTCQFWADYTKINITGKGKYLSAWEVESNIPEQIAMNKFKNKTKESDIKGDSLNYVLRNNLGDVELEKKIIEERHKNYALKLKEEFEVLKNGIHSQTALEKLSNYLKNAENYEVEVDKKLVKSLYDNMDIKYRESTFGEGIFFKIANTNIPQVGEKFVNVTLFDLEGNSHELNDYLDKYILLDFWTLGCTHCKDAHHGLKNLQKKYEKNLQVVGINVDVNKQLWEEATQRDNISWVNLSDGKGTHAGVYAQYGGKALPTFIFINPNGKIIERWQGFKEGIFEEKLSKYFQN